MKKTGGCSIPAVQKYDIATNCTDATLLDPNRSFYASICSIPKSLLCDIDMCLLKLCMQGSQIAAGLFIHYPWRRFKRWMVLLLLVDEEVAVDPFNPKAWIDVLYMILFGWFISQIV